MIPADRTRRALLASVVAVTLLAVTVPGCADSGGGGSIAGEWVVDEYQRQRGVVSEDIPETLPGERWAITGRAGCEGADCTFDLITTALEGPPNPIHLALRPDSGGSYVAELEFVSQCIDRATRRVLEPEASNVRSTYRVRLVGGSTDPELEITFDWDGSPTDRGLRAGCDIRSARFVARG